MILNIDTATIQDVLGISALSDLPEGKVFKRIASLEQAGDDDLAVVFDPGNRSVFDGVDQDKIKNTRAGAVIAASALLPNRTIVVPDALLAYQKLVSYAQAAAGRQPLQADERFPGAFVSTGACIAPEAIIQPGSIVLDGAVVGNASTIGSQVFVGRGVKIGSRVLLHPGVKVLDDCIIGDDSIVHAGAVIGSDGFGYQVTQQGLRKVPQIGIVRIGRSVEIGANCTVDRAAFDETVIGDGVKIDNLVHVAHNVQIGAGSAILAQTGIAGSVRIGIGCQIGGQVAIKDNLVIGDGARIVSKSGVMSSLQPNQTVAGIPAVDFNLWKRIAVALNYLPGMVKQCTSHAIKPDKKKSMIARLLGWVRS